VQRTTKFNVDMRVMSVHRKKIGEFRLLLFDTNMLFYLFSMSVVYIASNIHTSKYDLFDSVRWTKFSCTNISRSSYKHKVNRTSYKVNRLYRLCWLYFLFI